MLAIVLFVFIRFTDSNYHFGIFRLFRFLVYMLFVLLCFFFWPLCCLFFLDLRILITPLGWVSEWVSEWLLFQQFFSYIMARAS
jgi:hypothetical protein